MDVFVQMKRTNRRVARDELRSKQIVAIDGISGQITYYECLVEFSNGICTQLLKMASNPANSCTQLNVVWAPNADLCKNFSVNKLYQ